MRNALFALAILVASLQTNGAQQQPHAGVLAELPGSSLKWIHIAEPEFERQNLDVSKYAVSVVEDDDSVHVTLTNPHRKPGVRGNPGPLPEYDVEIRRTDGKVVRQSYIR